jgi:putative transposase
MPQKPTKEVLFGIQKQQLKHLSKGEYLALRELCFLSKNMYNVALYNIRQYYFTEKKFLGYNSNYHLCKDNENYALLNANSAQGCWTSLFKYKYGLMLNINLLKGEIV